MSHTPEQPLQIVDSLIYRLTDADGINTDEINVTMWEASRSLDVRAEGARRVLACVNAMADIPTESIETMRMVSMPRELVEQRDALAADNATLRAVLQTHAEEAAKLIGQRDELLAALEYYKDAVCGGDSSGGGYYSLEDDGHIARAAITSATKGEA